MPNLINRRKKKNKVLDSVVDDKSDSDSACSYEFSSKLNTKYNLVPDESKKQIRNNDKEVSIRSEIYFR